MMPVGVVKTPEDEKHWEAAKTSCRRKYKEGTDGFYRCTMGTFKRIKANAAHQKYFGTGKQGADSSPARPGHAR